MADINAALTFLANFLSGEDQQWSRMWGGAKPDKASPCTADTAYVNGPCLLYGVMITTAVAGANIELRDATAAGGGAVLMVIPSGASPGDGAKYMLPAPIPFNTGLFVDFLASATGTIVPIVLRPSS